MEKQENFVQNDVLINTYFELVKDLRNGIDSSVNKLTELWDEDGTFEFAGSPPLNGTFKGKTAIHVMYKNRCNSSNMKLELEGSEKLEDEYNKTVQLGPVETEIIRTKSADKEKSVVGWTTKIATTDGLGFNITGSHQFTFRNNKIVHLKIVVSPKPTKNESFELDPLSMKDVGRLSLAAWAVV